ncbi:MAG TPA: FAD binding domain-containing protein [Trebonia sp.]|nr:FAD binding domain-containing protein [Trebonia sp.]
MSPVLHRPETVEEACALLAADPSAMAFGGGTAIQILRKQGILFAESFVDLSLIPGLRDITRTAAGLRAGPMVTVRRMETTALVREVAPLAATAYGKVANPRVRNTASIGGNVAHGDYRLDPPVALLVLGGTIEATSAAGARMIPAAGFFVDFQQTDLRPGELVTAIEIPAMPTGATASYAKLSSLSANDWPCASAAALLTPAGGGHTLRLAIGALAPVPRLAAADVTGRTEEEVVEAALDLAETLMDPIPDVRGGVEYKRALGRVAVEDAVRGAWKSRAEGETRD